MRRRFSVALACALVLLIALAGLLAVVPRELDTVSKIADVVLITLLPIGFGLAWSWRRPLWAWLFASSIPPVYLILVVLFGLARFGGWFDLAFYRNLPVGHSTGWNWRACWPHRTS
jgi:hypothetical protein